MGIKEPTNFSHPFQLSSNNRYRYSLQQYCLRTFSSWIFVFTAFLLFARAKRCSNVTAAADGSTAPVILVHESLRPSTVPAVQA